MKSYLVLGLGKFGETVAVTLQEMGHEVLGVDSDARIVQENARRLTHTIEADLCNEAFLQSLDIPRFDGIIVAVGSNMQVSIMVTVLLKELGAQHIMVKAQDDFHERILFKLGADRVILPERDSGLKAARTLASNSAYDMIEISPDHSIVSIRPPVSWVGRTLGDLAVRAKYGITVIAIRTSGSDGIIPSAGTLIDQDAILTVLGSNQDLKRLGSIR